MRNTGMRYHDTGEPILCPDDFPVVITTGGIDGVIEGRPIRLNDLYGASFDCSLLPPVGAKIDAQRFLEECANLGM